VVEAAVLIVGRFVEVDGVCIKTVDTLPSRLVWGKAS
jgi:hypothetical protein